MKISVYHCMNHFDFTNLIRVNHVDHLGKRSFHRHCWGTNIVTGYKSKIDEAEDRL